MTDQPSSLFDSLMRSNGSDRSQSFSGSGQKATKKKTNTLSREGIAPSNRPTTLGSRFGKASSRKHPATDQQRLAETVFDKRRFLKKKEQPVHISDNGEADSLFLPRREWVSLGDGWYQTTPVGTGSSNRCGLHSVVDSSMGQLFVCVYEPRTQEGVKACHSENPEFDLSVFVKALKKDSEINHMKFDILLGFKSVTDFFGLTGDVTDKRWTLSKTEGRNVTVLSEIEMDIKSNVFYDILIQVRGGSISVDIDSVPIFTSVRFADTTGGSLNGNLGVMAKGTKFAIKGWQLRAAKRNINRSAEQSSSRRVPISLRDSLNISGSDSSVNASLGGSEISYNEIKIPRRGPPPVPSGGGGPGNYRGANRIQQSPPNCEADEKCMMLKRCRSILREKHDENIVEMVLRDIVQQGLGVAFEDIASLETAKRLLNEAVVLPLMMPEIFTGIRKPWKGVLLFGPPGTGKTMLAKAVADLNKAVFFCCSAASLISKFRGESEKIVKCLFEAARLCAPAIIFLDEIDALVSSRATEGEHEASRRLKTEFFSQMDGIGSHSEEKGSTQSDSGVMVLATTNCPWDLDEAIRRRLEKRIYIPLPDYNARQELFQICLRDIEVGPYITTETLSGATEGYSGADIHLVCREAAMMPMRRLLDEFSPTQINEMKQNSLLEIPPVSLKDFFDAIENTKPSVSQDCISKYDSWEREYGSK